MKKNYLIISVALFICMHINAKISVHVDIPGTLGEKIIEKGEIPKNVSELVVSGTLNDTDWTLMNNNLLTLHTLDIKNITNTTLGCFEPSKNTELSEVALPGGLEVLSGFKNCSKLRTIYLPDNLKKIDDQACYSCTSLQIITIPEGVTHIGYNAFGGCTSLYEINLPSTVRTIFDGAFFSTAIVEINLPVALDTLGGHFVDYSFGYFNEISGGYTDYSDDETYRVQSSFGDNGVFAGCIKLRSIIIPDNIKRITNSTFTGCRKLSSVELPEGLKSIGDYAFAGCKALKKIELPSTINEFDYRVFQASGLEEIELPANMIDIGYRTFKNCSSLRKLIVPAGLEDMGYNSFDETVSLTEIICRGKIPADMSDAGLSDMIKSIKLTVPTGAKMAYLTAPVWGNCLSIEEADGLNETRTLIINSNTDGVVNMNGQLISSGTIITVDRCNKPVLQLIPNTADEFYTYYYIDSIMVDGIKVAYANVVKSYDGTEINNYYYLYDKMDGYFYKTDDLSNFTVPMIVENTTVDIYFGKIGREYNLKTAWSGYNGNIYCNGEFQFPNYNYKIEYGKSYIFKFELSENYIVSELLYNGQNVTSEIIDNLYTTPVVEGDVSLSVTFAPKPSGLQQYADTSTKIWKTDGNIFIESENKIQFIDIFTLDGKKIYQKEGNGYSFMLPVNKENILLVKITHQNGDSRVFKIK